MYDPRGQFDPESGTWIQTGDSLKAQMELEKFRAEQERQRVQDMRSQGLNPDGSAIRPEWQSITDPSTGKLLPQYQLDLKGLDPSQWEGYSRFKQEALRQAGTDSPWAALQRQRQGVEEQDLRSQAARMGQSGMNQAISRLGMRGGVSNTSRAMLARGGMRDLLAERQRVGREGMKNRLDISMADEQSRLKGLGQLASSEEQIGRFNKELEGKVAGSNLQNLLREMEGKRAFDMGTYQEQMKKWAAERQAQATEKSSGGGK